MSLSKIAFSFAVASLAAFASIGDAHADSRSMSVMGTGNFRRAPAIAAAGSPKSATVTGLRGLSSKSPSPTSVRYLAVTNNANGKVTLVRAPVDKSKPVTKLTAAQAHRAGFITQSEAHERAEHNGGENGSPHAVAIRDNGMTRTGRSFSFTEPGQSKTTKDWQGNKIKYELQRTVTPSGSGESASGSWQQITK